MFIMLGNAKALLSAMKFDSLGLVPVIAQDRATGVVRMLAWANAQALRATVENGLATFWSRSRNELWEKGKTSGNSMRVVDLRLDCDGDAVLYIVEANGPSCHTNATSCFFRSVTPAGWPRTTARPRWPRRCDAGAVTLEEAVARILQPGGLLADQLPGFEPRPGQLAMARRVAQAIDMDERLLAEAGTGTGKTIAYLVPAILSGRKVVVSTGTRTLQDQIAEVDLPRLQRVLAEPFSFAVMKGLANYLCLRRFDEHSKQLEIAATKSRETERVRAWAVTTTTGDRADLDGVADSAPIWREITSSPEMRLGNRCPYVDRCFITQMRRRALAARVVVVNHHLFLADLALRSRWPDAQVLPPYELVIFDEAHQIEDIATEVFGVQVSSVRLLRPGTRSAACARAPTRSRPGGIRGAPAGGRDPRAG